MNFFSKTKFHFVNWRAWEPNPVLVKELRQAMRNPVLTTALMLLLSSLFAGFIIVLAKENFLVQEKMRLGVRVFSVFLAILTAITFVFVPLYVGVRQGLERRQSELDLLFATPLSPRRIVRGKLFCGMYLDGLFFSVCTPFMLFTNLLRGVDIQAVAVILVLLFLADCLAVQAAILLASVLAPTALKIVLGILFTAGLIVAGTGLVAFCLNLLGAGVPSVKNPDFWNFLFFPSFVAAVVIRVLYLASASLVRNDNRPRGYYGELLKQPINPARRAGTEIQSP